MVCNRRLVHLPSIILSKFCFALLTIAEALVAKRSVSTVSLNCKSAGEQHASITANISYKIFQ